MEQVVTLMEELSEDEVDIFIEPPEGDLSEQDSAGEDAGGLFDNLTSQQLVAPAEAVTANGDRIGTCKWKVQYFCHSFCKRAVSLMYCRTAYWSGLQQSSLLIRFTSLLDRSL